LPLFSPIDRTADFSSICLLILALPQKRDHLHLQGQHDAGQSRRTGNFQVCSVWVVSNPMETAMHKATITGTLTLLAAALLVSGSAQAGGGAASAASKYGHSTQVAAVHQPNRQAQSDFAITEYSSSSAKTHAPKYR
jgi:hypothetical protein